MRLTPSLSGLTANRPLPPHGVKYAGCIVTALLLLATTGLAQPKDTLIYHPIVTDQGGRIVSWYDADPGKSFDHVIGLVWNFWDTMRRDPTGLPYYMNHQVWKRDFDDPRGIGGDQFAMALSSWRLYYAYTGNERVKSNMFFLADYYLTHSLSPAGAKWPDLPFPYNCFIYSGAYDGDMFAGPGILQPDKAGSFGLELVHLYKLSEKKLYLQAAVKIANTLAAHTGTGNVNYSPLPFKVDPRTGKTALLRLGDFGDNWKDTAGYCSNWAPTLQLFLDLRGLRVGDTAAYAVAFDRLLAWMHAVPMKENKWGPFFEDVAEWSQTQINAMTFARFILEHRELFPAWKVDAGKIIGWVHEQFGNSQWKKYGVTVTNEQTVYPVPANSHSARQAADELLYVSLTGDSAMYENAVRELNWATYMVDFDGKNKFPTDEPWMTDGYGDYVRHFLRAMEVAPGLTPPGQDHILSSTSVIQEADYALHLQKYVALSFDKTDSNAVEIFYRCFDSAGTEKIKMAAKPSAVLLEGRPLAAAASGQGYTWLAMKGGGLLTVRRKAGKKVLVLK